MNIERTDDLDTRRELFYLCSRLTPANRRRALEWACLEGARLEFGAGALRDGIVKNKVSSRTDWNDPLELFRDLGLLMVQQRLDVDKLGRVLTALVRTQS